MWARNQLLSHCKLNATLEKMALAVKKSFVFRCNQPHFGAQRRRILRNRLAAKQHELRSDRKTAMLLMGNVQRRPLEAHHDQICAPLDTEFLKKV